MEPTLSNDSLNPDRQQVFLTWAKKTAKLLQGTHQPETNYLKRGQHNGSNQ